MVYITSSPDETIAVGREIAAGITAPRLILLEGDLGAGKTTLAKGIVSGLGAAGEDDVSSPTFALVQEYGVGPQVYHIDLYRLDGNPDLDSLGLEDIWDSGAVVLIEWGGRFKARFPAKPVEIRLQYLDGDRRKIEVDGLPAESAA
jgi:tRNA threonylcarbamoyladenosine biosynthesis protein TsaE